MEEIFMPQNNHIFVFDDKEAQKIINSAQPVIDTRDGSITPCIISGIELNEPFEGLATYYLKSDYLEDNDKKSSTFGWFFAIIIENMG